MEKLDRKDLRFIAVCLLVIAAGAAITGALFPRAFPEASIEFKVNRAEARKLAQGFLAGRGANLAGMRFAGQFDVDETPKIYLERELGLERAGKLYGREAKIWLWRMRWFRSGVTEEERVAFSPLGDLIGFRSVLKEEATGARLTREEARSRVLAFLASRGLPETSLRSIEATPVSRPNRTDWDFVDEKAGREARGSHDPLRDDGFGRPRHGVPRVRPRSRDLDAGLRTAAVEERGRGAGRHGRPHRDGPRHARRPRRQDRAQGRPVAARRRLRRHRLRALASLRRQRPSPDALRLRHGELPAVVPDEPDRSRHPRRDRHGRGDRPRGRRGRADLPRALPGEGLARRRLLAARHPDEGVPARASSSATRWSRSSSPTRPSSTSSPGTSAPGRRPTSRTATCSTRRSRGRRSS